MRYQRTKRFDWFILGEINLIQPIFGRKNLAVICLLMQLTICEKKIGGKVFADAAYI